MKINPKLLQRQRQELLALANDGHPNLHGVVHLLDAILEGHVLVQSNAGKEVPSLGCPVISRPLSNEDLDRHFDLEDAHRNVPFQLEVEGADIHWLDTAVVQVSMLRVYWKILHAVKMATGIPLFDIISKELSVAMDKHARRTVNL